MELKAGHPVPDVNERRARVLLYHVAAFLERLQDRHPGARLHFPVIAARGVEVVRAPFPRLVKTLLARGEQLFDQLGDLPPVLAHLRDRLLDPDRVPELEGAELVVEPPLHRVVEVDYRVRDLGDAVRRVDEVAAYRLP
jgi:hypothetical protein